MSVGAVAKINAEMEIRRAVFPFIRPPILSTFIAVAR